jgi:hypothetical protein
MMASRVSIDFGRGVDSRADERRRPRVEIFRRIERASVCLVERRATTDDRELRKIGG